MMDIRAPVVAGMFYPGTEHELRHAVDGYMAEATSVLPSRPHALIAPHAGYQYSGSVAANAYATLLPWVDKITKVAVLAPSHRVPFRGIATNSAEGFKTPLGTVKVEREIVDAVERLPGVSTFDDAFAQEHAMEVQLPFLQSILPDFTLVPLIVGNADNEDVARVIEHLVDDDLFIVVSSDLSHYHDYLTCRLRDRDTTVEIERLHADAIGPYDACGAYPIRGLLAVAANHGWQAKTLDLRNSGDTAGNKSQVVGYGAYAFI